MNSVQSFFHKYVASTLVSIGVFLLVNCLLLFVVIAYTDGYDSPPTLNITDLAGKITEVDRKIHVEDEAVKQLDAVNAWAMLLDGQGDVIWENRLPAQLKRSYSMVDVAQFSRWYLDGYPVSVWEHDLGLLVVGYPRESMVKYFYTVEPEYYSRMAVVVVFAFIANLILMLFLLLKNTYKIEKSLKPILAGIGIMVQGKPVHLEEKGELSKIEEAINHTSEYLQQKDTARAEWINGISHDIRTPLSVILGYASEMEDDPTLPQQVNERAGLIRRQGEKLRQRIIDLNLTSRLEYAMQPMNVKQINPIELVRQSVSDFLNNGLDGKYSIDLSAETGASRIEIEGDVALLSRMLDNAIGNSIKHNPSGCDIHISVNAQNDLCIFIVQDNGVGVDPTKLKDLNSDSVDTITQSELGEAAHGNGVKLIKKIAEAHNGTVFFVETKPHGLLVKIQLPAISNGAKRRMHLEGREL